jgi:hypothetical protein
MFVQHSNMRDEDHAPECAGGARLIRKEVPGKGATGDRLRFGVPYFTA